MEFSFPNVGEENMATSVLNSSISLMGWVFLGVFGNYCNYSAIFILMNISAAKYKDLDLKV